MQIKCFFHLDQERVGDGIPAVSRHWKRALPPAETVCDSFGYMSIWGNSRPIKRKKEKEIIQSFASI